MSTAILRQDGIHLVVSSPSNPLVINGRSAGNLKIYNLQFCLDTVRHYARKGNPIAQANLEKILTLDSPFRRAILSGEITLHPLETDNSKKATDLGDLYVFLDEKSNVCKIGRSSNVVNRLKSIQTGYPHKLVVRSIVKGKGFAEKEVHFLLNDFRLNGEWFSDDCLPMFDRITDEITITPTNT